MNIAVALPQRNEDLQIYLKKRSAEVAVIRNGFIELPIDRGFLQPHLAVIRSGMQRITETTALREAFPSQIVGEDAYGDRYKQEVGLKARDDNERKWWFQYTPEAYGMLSPNQGKVGAFLGALRALDAKAMEIAVALAERFDAYKSRKDTMRKYPGSMAQRVRKGRCITRVLRYLSVERAANAYPHVDRSAFSVHWGATHKGLVLFAPNGDPLQVNETGLGSVAIFPGEKFAAMSRGLLGLGTPHGVRYQRTADEDRYAFVSFVHPAAQEDDAAWLLQHREEIEAYERSFTL